jgi:hypothetical protein
MMYETERAGEAQQETSERRLTDLFKTATMIGREVLVGVLVMSVVHLLQAVAWLIGG